MVDTSSLSSVLHGDNQVIVTQLTSEQLTPLAENIINTDDGTVVALDLADYQVFLLYLLSVKPKCNRIGNFILH